MNKEEFLERQMNLFEDIVLDKCGGTHKCDLKKRMPDTQNDPECIECWEKLKKELSGVK